MPEPARKSTSLRLEAWANDLDAREAALATDRARFEDQARRFKAKAEAIVTRKTDDITDALELIREVFPMGLVFAPVVRSARGSVH